MPNTEKPSRGVVITGGADGIGFQIAQRFLQDGHPVHIADVNEEAVDRATLQHAGLSGSVTNMGDAESASRLFAEARSALPNISVLINNVGIGGPHAPIEEISNEDWNEQIQVNLSGAFYLTKQIIPLLKAQKSGSIINISTASVRTVPPFRAGYVVTKAALEAFTIALARELGPFNINSNAIRPGLMNNPRMTRIIKRNAAARNITEQALMDEYLQHVDMNCMIEMDEIADTALFLASPAASHITAQIIAVDGNMVSEP